MQLELGFSKPSAPKTGFQLPSIHCVWLSFTRGWCGWVRACQNRIFLALFVRAPAVASRGFVGIRSASMSSKVEYTPKREIRVVGRAQASQAVLKRFGIEVPDTAISRTPCWARFQTL